MRMNIDEFVIADQGSSRAAALAFFTGDGEQDERAAK